MKGIFWLGFLFVAVKMTSKLYLAYYPHAFVWQYFSVLKYWFVVIILVTSFDKVRNFVLRYYRKSEIVFLFILGLMVIGSLAAFSWKGQLNLRDDTVYYETGFDQLTYYSWSREILMDKKLFIEPTITFSKSFYLYFRSAQMAIFGDGTMWMDTAGVWMLMVLPVLFLVVVLLNNKSGWLMGITILLSVYWYLVMNGWFIRFVSNLSEMPAWFFIGLASILALDKKINQKWIYFLFLMSFLMRTMVVVYLPILLVLIYIKRKIEYKNLFVFGLTGILLIFLQSRIGVLNNVEIGNYATQNMSTNIVERIPQLIPSNYELVILLLLTISMLRKKSWLVLGIVLLSFVMQLPLFNNFYPQRNLFWLYWMLTVLAVGLW